MRQIGTLPDGDTARKLADYLLTLKIETRLEQQPDAWIVWACDEDRVAEARQQFAEFTRNPQDARFAGAAKAAHELRLREIEEDEDYRQRMSDFRKRMTEPTPPRRYVAVVVMVIAAVVTMMTNLGEPKEAYQHALLNVLKISTSSNLAQVAHGEVWRLVTPILIHFGFMHLLFNCFVFSDLAGQVERIQGSLRLLWLVVLIAVVSNLSQFYFGHMTVELPLLIVLRPDANFGGLSGVGYGLFGYLWMKTRFEPGLGFQMSQLTTTLLLIWFVVCLSGLMGPIVGPIANAAHASGLFLGLIIGAGPHLLETLRKR